MNKQAIFDVIVNHAIKQHTRAMDDSERCQYLTEDGNKCFVGVLIPRHMYSSDMEGTGVGYVIKPYPSLIPIILPTDMALQYGIEFMENLQKIHDHTLVIFWGEDLRKFADDYGLKFMDDE